MSLKVFACGDLVNFNANYDFVDKELQNIIQSSDLSICNFEAPISHDDMCGIKKAGPHVYQSRKSVEILKNTGFNLVSLANNHIYDYGQKGIEETIDVMDKYGIKHVGGGRSFEEAYQVEIVDINGIKVGFLAGCENEFGCLYEEQGRGGYAWIFHYNIEDNVKHLKNTCDFVVLLAHAGVENIEIPIKEWRDRYKRLCDVGVDVVIGGHPHVPQGYERCADSIIFYSLGNFYFDTASFAGKSDDSYSVELIFDKNKEIDFNIYHHKKINNQTSFVQFGDVDYHLEYLCDLLGPDYEKRNEETCLNLFNQYYYDYYKLALGLLPENAHLFSKVKKIIRKAFFSKRHIDNKNLMLLHNISIDSHRFVVQRALSLLSE